MVVLTGDDRDKAFMGRVPELALQRARELRGQGVSVLVLEEGDDVCRDFRVVGRYGLLTYIDDHYQAPFEYVRYVLENGRKVYEALLAPSCKYLLVAPDEKWLDDQLQVVLDVEGEEVSP